MAAALWAALRHVEALQTSFTKTMMALKPHQSFWPNYGIELSRRFSEAPGQEISIRAGIEGTASSQPIEMDHGVERSSASWNNFENFTTTSMYVRLLGALEQFEIDTLKSLLYYRPKGKAEPPLEQFEVNAEEHVVFEIPQKIENKDCYEYPPLWTWIETSALEKSNRGSILKRAYGIKRFKPLKSERNFEQLYEDRNSIAHGRRQIEVSVDDVLKLYSFVLNSIFHIRDQVFEKYRLNL